MTMLVGIIYKVRTPRSFGKDLFFNKNPKNVTLLFFNEGWQAQEYI